MIDEAEIHRMANSEDVEERRKAAQQLYNFAAISDKDKAWADLHRLTKDKNVGVRVRAADALGSAFSNIPDKDKAWADLHRLIQDEDKNVRWWTINALSSAFSDIPDKDTAWADLYWLIQDDDNGVRAKAADALGRAFHFIPNKDMAWSDLHQLTKDENSDMRWIAADALGRAFSDLPDKDTAWSDLHQLTNDEVSYVREIATGALGRAFHFIPDKDMAWSDLHQLTKDENSDMRQITAYALSRAFSDIPDKNTAWSDLHQLTQDENSNVRWVVADALGRAFSDLPDKDTAWADLYRLTLDKESNVQMHAYHSLGSASVYKATETEDEEKFRDEIKKAIDYFESSSRESVDGYYNPARFCLPFYRSYYAVISEKHEAETEAAKYLDEAKNATEGSESRKALLKSVENLANALKEAQKPLDFNEKKEHLRVCRQYCDHTAELADSTRGKSPMAAAVIMRGIPIVGMKIKVIIAEIQEKAKEACKQAQGTPTEEIACAVNQEVQKWHIVNQEDMTQKVDNLVFSLKSKIPNNPQNKHIHEKIEKIREESNMAKHYEMVSLLIALIPTASVHTGDVINADVKASGKSQVVVKGNENKNASYDAPASKKSLIRWINSPATIAAFVGFMCAEIGTYYYPVTYNHLISVGIAGLVFIIVAVFDKE